MDKPLLSQVKNIIWDAYGLPKKAGKELDKIFPFTWEWPEGKAYLEQENQRTLSVDQLQLLSQQVWRRYHVLNSFKRYADTKDMHPYIEISRGTSIGECPMHEGDAGTIHHIDDEYWKEKPVGLSVFCSCRINQLPYSKQKLLLNE